MLGVGPITLSWISLASLAFSHAESGHSDKLSLGECYRATDDKDFCQDNKDSWKEAREDTRGPPNGDQDGEPADPDFDD